MLSVDDAIAEILAGAAPLGGEIIPLDRIYGRVAAVDIRARLTQPPFSASAMDGYAVRFEDAQKDVRLNVIGEAPAGAPFTGAVGAGEAVRIFTGGPVPDGADHIVIQEDVTRKDNYIIINEDQERPRHIRPAGVDFKEGDKLVRAGEIFHEIHGAIIAAANIAEAAVLRRPRVALFSNGDELMEPGAALKPGQIINSNHYALTAMIQNWGGETEYLGCAADDEAAIRSYFERAQTADIIVPVGGASVGDYDFVKSAFRVLGGEIAFEKVAVRPGKPTWCGKIGNARVVGLPGNPASAIVTAALFVQPLVRLLAGNHGDQAVKSTKAVLAAPLKANGARETYLRASLQRADDGVVRVTAAANQDSSLLSPFTTADVLIRRPINAPAAAAGDQADIVPLR